MTLHELMQLPWTVQVEKRSDDGTYFVARIAELPGFVAAGEDDEELSAAFWDALRSHLQSYLEHGEQPPLPKAESPTTNESWQGHFRGVGARQPA